MRFRLIVDDSATVKPVLARFPSAAPNDVDSPSTISLKWASTIAEIRNYYDRERRSDGDQPTLGLVLCSDKNDAVVRYTLGEQEERNVFATRYQLHLPTVEQLQDELVRERRQLVVQAPESPRRSSRTRTKQ